MSSIKGSGVDESLAEFLLRMLEILGPTASYPWSTSNRAMILVTVFIWLCIIYSILTRYGREDGDDDDGNGTGGVTVNPWVGDWWEFKALNGIIRKSIDYGTTTILIISGFLCLRVRRPSFRVSSASSVTPSVAAVPSDLDPGLDPSAVVPIANSIPEIGLSHPWYLSNELVAGLGCFIVLCAVYLLFSHFHDHDDGGDKPKGPTGTSSIGISSSGIPCDKGLPSVLPSQDASPDGSSDDFMWWGSFGRGRFDASPGNGEPSVRLCSKGFACFPYGFLHLIWVFTSRWAAANRLFCLIFAFFVLCCLSSTFKGSVVSKCSMRKYILLTLSHADGTVERGALTADLIIARLKEAFVCKSIVISKEIHSSMGFHYHVGLWNESASKYTAISKLRGLFPEFEGCQLDVSYHKGWNTICAYLLKEDKSPVVWGEESLDLVRERASSAAGKRRGPDLVKLLREKSSWEEVMADDNLVKKCLSSYSSVRNTFTDMQAAKRNTHFFERLVGYVKEKGGLAYTGDELKERLPLLTWLAFNLCRKRHLRQRQMLVLGEPGTHKTDMVQSLSQFLNVYFVSRRAKDFTGADRDYDLWVIDELAGYEADVDMLNVLLDGQKVSLDCKYGRVFEKLKNVPIILISNRLPYNCNVESFRTRVHEMHFFSDCAPIDAGRLASTLFVRCIFYYIITLPEGDGINNHLGKELVSDAEKAMLEIRTGDPFLFGPLREIDRLRKDEGLVAFLRRSYEVFGLSVDIEFPKALYQWEKNSNYWDAVYKSLNSAAGPSSIPIPSKCNSLSSPVAPSTTVNKPIRPRKEVALGEEEDFFAKCMNFSDLPDSDGD